MFQAIFCRIFFVGETPAYHRHEILFVFVMFNLWRDSIDSQLEKRCSFYGCIELACFSRISDNYSPSDNQNWADLYFCSNYFYEVFLQWTEAVFMPTTLPSFVVDGPTSMDWMRISLLPPINGNTALECWTKQRRWSDAVPLEINLWLRDGTKTPSRAREIVYWVVV